MHGLLYWIIFHYFVETGKVNPWGTVSPFLRMRKSHQTDFWQIFFRIPYCPCISSTVPFNMCAIRRTYFRTGGKIITAGVDNVELIDAAVQFFYKISQRLLCPVPLPVYPGQGENYG